MTMTDATGTASYLMLITETLEAQGVPFNEAVLQAITEARQDKDAPRVDRAAIMAFGTLAMREWTNRGATGDDHLRLLDELGALILRA